MEEPLDELVVHEGEHQQSDEDETGEWEMFEKEIELDSTSLDDDAQGFSVSDMSVNNFSKL